MAIAEANLSRRALSKERRRQQLIDATIKGISKKSNAHFRKAVTQRQFGDCFTEMCIGFFE